MPAGREEEYKDPKAGETKTEHEGRSNKNLTKAEEHTEDILKNQT